MISIRKKTKSDDSTNSEQSLSRHKAGWLHISQRTESGLILLSELSKSCTQPHVSLRDIAKRKGISFYFLQKIAMDLRKAGLISSSRGKNGGYSLSKDATNITLKDIFEAHEGHLSILPCLDNEACSRDSSCTVKPGLSIINKNIIDILESTSLSEFLNPSKK